MKIFLYETSLNGGIYASSKVPLTESPLPVLLPPLPLLPPLGIGIVIKRLPSPLDAATGAATEALVATVKVKMDEEMDIDEKRQEERK